MIICLYIKFQRLFQSLELVHERKSLPYSLRNPYLDFDTMVESLVIPKETRAILTTKLDVSKWPLSVNVFLVVTEFNKPGQANMLLGVSHFL